MKFYLTTAIAYVNAPPHLGFAMELIQADAIARYKRLMGYDTHFLTGTDEHGVKIYNTAMEAKEDTKEFVDRHAAIFKSLKGILNLSTDDFIQTSDRERHWPAAQKIWKALEEKGDIYEKEYEGLYCVGCETFLKETDLIEGKCPIHQKEPVVSKETNYFFRLSKYSEEIVRLIETDELKLMPESRKKEFLIMAKEGLLDVSFSRPRSVLPWGVVVPSDENHVMYVWCDALTNYISAIGYAKDPKTFNKWWPADLHVIGKDIVRFHAGIWIGMLLSAGLPLPKAILAHGFVTHNGEKMSKSTGNVVDPIELLKKYEVDMLRYYLLREVPVGKDGDFSDHLFIERYNSDLANNLGNLLNRVHTLISRNSIEDFEFEEVGGEFESMTNATHRKYVEEMEKYNLSEAIFQVWKLVDFANKMMEEKKPWALIKENPAEGKLVLCNLLEILRHITLFIAPFMPETSQKMRIQLGLPSQIPIEVGNLEQQPESGWSVVKDWKKLGESEIIFPRNNNQWREIY